MSDYLFDKQGDPDPEVRRLEGLLRPFAYRGAPPPPPPRRRPRAIWISVGAAAIAALVLLLVLRPWTHAPAPLVPPQIAKQAPAEPTRLRIGEIGNVELAVGTRARIVENGPKQYRVQLDRGTLSAVIHAPPRMFVVETPRARVIDLGCAFEITVDEAGEAKVVVSEGKVAVADAGAHEVVVPAGSSFPPQRQPLPVPLPPKPKSKPAIKHAVQRHQEPVQAPAPARTPAAAPVRKAAPAKKTEPDSKFEHDPFKNLP